MHIHPEPMPNAVRVELADGLAGVSWTSLGIKAMKMTYHGAS